MSVNCKVARDSGKLPLTNISSKMLKAKGFPYPRTFYVYLCRRRYIVPEYHHASAAKRFYKYYDLNSIPFIVKNYDLENLYLLYRNKRTKDQILRDRGVEYVTVAVSGKKYKTQRIMYFDGVQIDGHIFWKPGVAIDMLNARIVANYGFEKPESWTNSNTKKIIHKALIYKRVKVKRFI